MPKYDPDKEKVRAAEREKRRQQISAKEKEYLGTLAKLKTLESPRPGEVARFDPIAGSLSPLVFSPDGKLLAGVDSKNAIVLLDLATGKQYRKLTDHTKDITGLGFTPDGRKIASGGRDNVVRIWDLEENRLLKAIDTNKGVSRLAVSPDGKRIAICENNYTANSFRVLDMGSYKEEYGDPGDTTSGVAFSSAGLLAVYDPLNVRICDARTGKKIAGHAVKDSLVSEVAFSPDGWTLAIHSFTIGAENKDSLILWDLANDRKRTLTNFRGEQWKVAFMPDGKSLTSKGVVTEFWDLESGKRTSSVNLQVSAVSPGGEILAVPETYGLCLFATAHVEKK
jgi:WD40 repeat protein